IASTKLSNHDEDRAGSTLGKSAIKEKQAAAFLLTAEGKPFIYQGEELGYYGTKANGDEYVRTPMKWTKSGAVAAKKLDGKVDNAMLTENISVEAQQSDANSVLGTYRKFLAVRNSYPALYSGKMSEHQTYNASFPNPGISCWYMTSGSETLLVVHNVNTSAVAIEFTDSLDKMVICLGTATTKQTTAGWYLTLGGNSSVIFKVK
ncbi:MAG: alpha-amylase, partial [Bacteroidales bacterium]|nr:alpha-amylase [Bacteroidales bacterium]